jgi:predicted RNA-binding protein
VNAPAEQAKSPDTNYLEEVEMCLSKVFLRQKEDGSVIVEEASRVTVDHGKVEIQTLFGEKKILDGYFIKEIDLLKNSILLDAEGKR